MDLVRPSPFSDAAINAAIDRAHASVGEGETVAFVAVATKDGDTFKTQMTISVRIGDEWSFAGFVAGDVKNPLQKAGAELRWSH